MGTKLPSALKVGDRVSRQIEVGKEPRRFGIVAEVYKSTPGYMTSARRLYAVKWDDIGLQRGYVEEGLQIER